MSTFNQKVIPIFFATNDNYAPFLSVSLTSMLENASTEYVYKVYVLTTSLKQQNMDNVCSVADKFSNRVECTVEFISLEKELDKIQSLFHLRDYYSKETYYRFFIPNLFPEYDKVLYMDCDIIILDDVAKLYNTELGENLVAAAPEEVMTEVDVFGNYVEKALDCHRESYFNAGILLINSRLFRLQHIADQFVEMIQRFTFRVTQDEDYLNVLCKGKTVLLDLGWNKTAFHNDKFDDKNLKIAHYKIHWKPWHYSGVEYENYFWEYAEKAGMAEPLLQMRSSYTKEEKLRDDKAYTRLMEMARVDAEDPENYRNSLYSTKSYVMVAFTKLMELVKMVNLKNILSFWSHKIDLGDSGTAGRA